MSVPPYNRSSGSDRPQPSKDEPEGTSRKPFKLPQPKNNPPVNQRNGQPDQQEAENLNQPQPNQKKNNSSSSSQGTQKNNKGEDSNEPSDLALPKLTEKEEKDEEGQQQFFSKKDKTDLLQAELATQQQTQIFYGQAGKGGVSEIQKVEMTKVIALIQKMIDQIASTGQIGQTQMTSLQLKGTEVPQLFAGATINITQSELGLVIQFDKFQTPQQENAALNLVRANSQALEGLMKGLADRNLTLAQLNIGSHSITLPRVETPFLFQSPQSSGEQSRGYQDQEKQERQRRDSEPDEDE